jgi:predicted nucleotidyltransferase
LRHYGYSGDMEKFNIETPFSREQHRAIETITGTLEKTPEITAARIYGSWLHKEHSVDLDLAVMASSERGIISASSYERLRLLRGRLAEDTGYDVDLVPHTEDELVDLRSPLYNPRYNPSLLEGRDIKGAFTIEPSYKSLKTFDFGDLTASVLYDNRTVCRRQLVRGFSRDESRIFVSKLSHGAGNALTYYACKNHIPYIASPSDWFGALYRCDELYGTESDPALDFLRGCRDHGVNDQSAISLMRWHEFLLAAVLRGGDAVGEYNAYCETVSP